jgi:hypothetical protein
MDYATGKQGCSRGAGRSGRDGDAGRPMVATSRPRPVSWGDRPTAHPGVARTRREAATGAGAGHLMRHTHRSGRQVREAGWRCRGPWVSPGGDRPGENAVNGHSEHDRTGRGRGPCHLRGFDGPVTDGRASGWEASRSPRSAERGVGGKWVPLRRYPSPQRATPHLILAADRPPSWGGLFPRPLDVGGRPSLLAGGRADPRGRSPVTVDRPTLRSPGGAVGRRRARPTRAVVSTRSPRLARGPSAPAPARSGRPAPRPTPAAPAPARCGRGCRRRRGPRRRPPR